MKLFLLLPVAAALLAPWLVRRLGRAAAWLLAAVPAALAVYAASRMPAPGDVPEIDTVPWAASLGVELVLRWDGLSASFVLLATTIAVAVVLHAGGYLAGDRRLGRLLALLLVFLAAMLGLVLADHAVALFVFWELTGVVSFLLIAFDPRQESARRAARNALAVTAGGGLALLVGLLLAARASVELGLDASEAMRLSAWASVDLTSHPLYPAIVALVAVGALTKSAQAPFHFWLAGAMTAPTPVSAFLHSATLVKAGIFLLARLHEPLGGTAPWLAILGGAGGLTMILGAVAALRARDLKAVLAGSTVSVLGILTLLLGIGDELAVKAAVVFLFAHGLYKSALFLVAGNIDLATGTRQLGRLGGLGRVLPWTAAAGALAALSKAGAPPTFGFIGKELVYKAKLALSEPVSWIVLAAVLANIALVATALEVGVRPFVGRARRAAPRTPRRELAPELVVGPLALAAGGLFVGLVPDLFDRTVGSAAASAILGRPVAMRLSLWHGLNTEALLVVALSVVTLGGGVALYSWIGRRGASAAPRAVVAELWNTAYDGFVERLAPAVTDRLAAGSRRRHLTYVVLAVAAAGLLPALRLAAGSPWTWHRSGVEGAVGAGLVIAGALAAVATGSRWAGLAAVGTSGIGLALLFAVHSAPDLAITQILVEALAVLLLLLVLRGLPRPRPERRTHTWVRALAAITVGCVAAVGVVAAAQVDLPTDLAEFFRAESVPAAKGRNVVNVILVDFRALDTMGEILVVALAAIGAAALLARPAPRPHADDASGDARQRSESVILTAVSRPLLAILVLFSIFLLLRGHDEPGGGFIAGLLAAAGFSLRALASGPAAARRELRVAPGSLIAGGLSLALAAGLAGLLARGSFLAHLWFPAAIPSLTKLGTATLFDVGVYLVVLGASTSILASLEEA